MNKGKVPGPVLFVNNLLAASVLNAGLQIMKRHLAETPPDTFLARHDAMGPGA